MVAKLTSDRKTIATKNGIPVSDDEAYTTTREGKVLRDGYALRVSLADGDPIASALLAALAAPAPVRSVAIVDGAGTVGLNTPGFRFQSHAVADAARVTQDFLKTKARAEWISSDRRAWRDSGPRKAGDACHLGNGETGHLAWAAGGLVCIAKPAGATPVVQASGDPTGDRAKPDFAGQRAARDAYAVKLTDAWRRR